MAANLADDILNAFSWMKSFRVLYFDSNFTEVVPRGQIDNMPALVQVMAWRRIGDKSIPDHEPKHSPPLGIFTW